MDGENGSTQHGIMLIPAATETKAFHDQRLEQGVLCSIRQRTTTFPLHRRHTGKGQLRTAIVLAGYGVNEISALQKSNLGKLIIL